jgi:glycosyltransferase involved in cell wall biosynthesis
MKEHTMMPLEESPHCEPASGSSYLPLPRDTASGSSFVPLPSPLSTLPSPLSTAVETVRVLHLINGEHYAGAERVQDLLAKRLPEFGYSVGFACVKLDAFDAMRDSRDAPLYDVRMRTRFDLLAARKIAGIVRDGDYRVLHGHTVRTALVGGVAARLTGVPLVCHAHSPTSRDSTRRWMNRINGAVERLSLRNVSRVIAVSRAMAEHIAAEGFDPARIRVVPNGVPGPATLPRRTAPAGCWTLGMVALFRPRKGLEVLLDAMAILLRLGIPVHLRAVGTFESSKYETEIAARIRHLHLNEHVSWTGFTRQIDAELRKMDLFVLPSLFGEGLPMVVLEAMAAGVPVVATRVPGVPEAIRHGQDGVLTDPNDADKLAQAIAGVVNGCYNWEKLRVCAFERHALQFSDQTMAAGVAAVYKEVLAPQKTTPTGH